MPKILLFGAGSQARLVLDLIQANNHGDVVAIYDPTRDRPSFDTDITYISQATELPDILQREQIRYFHVCIGNQFGRARCQVASFLKSSGLNPLSIISKNAIIDDTSEIEEGSLIMPGVIVQKFARIGPYCVINSGAIIEHEVELFAGVHVMSGAVITGRVSIEEYATIGANATILPDLTVSRDSFVGAGATVTSDIPEGVIVAGCPAKIIKKNTVQSAIL